MNPRIVRTNASLTTYSYLLPFLIMPTIVPDQNEKLRRVEIDGNFDKEDTSYSITPLGQPQEEKKFWFQRRKDYNPNAIATQVRDDSKFI